MHFLLKLRQKPKKRDIIVPLLFLRLLLKRQVCDVAGLTYCFRDKNRRALLF
jgi:hypothetical protein